MSNIHPYRRAVVINDGPILKTISDTLATALKDELEGQEREPLAWEDLIQGISRALLGPRDSAGATLDDVQGAFEDAQAEVNPLINADILAKAVLDALGLDPDDLDNNVSLGDYVHSSATEFTSLADLFGRAREEADKQPTEKLLGDLYTVTDGGEDDSLDFADAVSLLEASRRQMGAASQQWWDDGVSSLEEAAEVFTKTIDDLGDSREDWAEFLGGLLGRPPKKEETLAEMKEQIRRKGTHREGQHGDREEALIRLRDRLLGPGEGEVTGAELENMLETLGPAPEF